MIFTAPTNIQTVYPLSINHMCFQCAIVLNIAQGELILFKWHNSLMRGRKV